MKSPDRLWYDIAYRYAKQSKCRSRHVGCVLVYEDRSIGQGWNGAPDGSSVNDCKREKCCNSCIKSGVGLSDAICCHAEINCIGYCARHGVATRGSTLYCTTFPCLYCAGALVAAGVREVVYDVMYGEEEDNKITFTIFEKAKVKVRRFSFDDE